MVVVLVEDDEGLAEATRMLLEFEGYETRVFHRAGGALDYLEGGGHASLIVLDLTLPDLSGMAFRMRLLADPRLSRVPVAVYSALDRSAVDVPGVIAHVQKPDVDVLLKVVAEYAASAA